MSGTHSNAVIIEKTANIIGVVFTEIKSNNAKPVLWAIESEIRYRFQL
ncbi:Uncharacterised protein [Shigella sonnei]|nr:Uncharacterised protein [Shigella sonnei]